MKIKLLILYVFVIIVLIIPQSSAEINETTVELSIDKQNYKVNETLNVTIYLNSDKPLTGGLNIYAVITEKRSEAYVQLLGTVPCSSCAGGRPESLAPPYRETFHRQITEPGRYYVEANFNNVAKKIYFNVTGDEKEVNETENEITVNETGNKTEVNETVNKTDINETKTLSNLTETETTKPGNIKLINKTSSEAGKENLTTKPVTGINESKIIDNISQINGVGDKTVTTEEKKPLYFYVLMAFISILIVFAVVVIVFLVRKK